MFTCVDCHTDVKSAAHETTPKKITCATCHADEQAAYDRSFHGKAVQAGNSNAATCVDCHGSPHELLPASRSEIARASHQYSGDLRLLPRPASSSWKTAARARRWSLRIRQSVHGHAVANGSDKAAVCTDCHGAHEILDAKDSKSPIFKFNVPHDLRQVPRHDLERISAEHSRHGHRQGQLASACLHRLPRHPLHQGAHRPEFSRVGAERGPGHMRALPRRRPPLAGIRIEGRRETTYLASYHGLASTLGSQVVANCASCHGTHSIFPSSDPRSTIQSCEPGTHLRAMPSRRDRKIHRRQSSRRCAALCRHRQQSGSLDSQVLSRHDLRRDRRHAAAQLHHLALEG